MAGERVEIIDAEQCMDETTVPYIYLWRLHQPLPGVRVKGGKPPHQQQIYQEVDIAVHGLHAYAQRPREPGRIQDASLAVGKHDPETFQRLGRQARAKRGHVAFQIGPDGNPCVA